MSKDIATGRSPSDADFLCMRKEQNENLLFTSPPFDSSRNTEERMFEFVYHIETVNGKSIVCSFSHCYGSDGQFRRYILDSDYESGVHYEFSIEDELKLLIAGGYPPDKLRNAPRLFVIIKKFLKERGVAECVAFFRSVFGE